MAIPSQFSLSLELTKLVPLQQTIGKTAEAVLSLARDLQNSGSDIVIEEDLADLFGHCHISAQLESSFKTCLTKPKRSYELCEGLFIEGAAGPTVSRALTNGQGAYFAFVLQISLLAWVHDREALASAIVQTLEERNWDAPPSAQIRAVPLHDGLVGVLRACQEQTSDYDWTKHLQAIGTRLDEADSECTSPIAPAVLRGLSLLLPYVQSLPEDRMIVASIDSGVCLIVAWAHLILGLNVLVRQLIDPLTRGTGTKEQLFGSEPVNMIIEYGFQRFNDCNPIVTLVETTTKNKLFSIVPDDDEDLLIDSLVKIPLRGYGRKVLNVAMRGLVEAFDEIDGKNACIKEIIFVTTALATRLSHHLFKSDFSIPDRNEELRHMSTLNDLKSEEDENGEEDVERIVISGGSSIERCDEPVDGPNLLEVPIDKIASTAHTLFDVKSMPTQTLSQFASQQEGLGTQDILPPSTFMAAAEKLDYGVNTWQKIFLPIVSNLAVLILALSHASNISEAMGLLLRQDLACINNEAVSRQALAWNGSNLIYLQHDDWFSVLAALMIGHQSHNATRNTEPLSLVSDRNWTIHLATYGDIDPCYVGK